MVDDRVTNLRRVAEMVRERLGRLQTELAAQLPDIGDTDKPMQRHELLTQVQELYREVGLLRRALKSAESRFVADTQPISVEELPKRHGDDD